MNKVKKIINILIFLTLVSLVIGINISTTYIIVKIEMYSVVANVIYKFGIILLVLYLLYKIVNKEKIKFKDIIAILLSICAYFSYKYALNPKYALEGFPGRYEGLYMLLTYYIIFLSSSTLPKKYKKIIMNVFLLTGIYQVYIGIFQFCKLDYVFNYYRGNNFSKKYNYASGTIGNPNFYSTYIALCLMYSLSKIFDSKHKFIYLLLTFYFMLGLLIGDTLSCIISCILVSILLLLRRVNRKNIKKVLIIIPILLVLINLVFNISDKYFKTKIIKRMNKNINEINEIITFGIDDSTGSGRIYLWKTALELSKSNLVNGIGIDNFGVSNNGSYQMYVDGTNVQFFDKVHNEYLQILVTEGVFAFISYILLLIYVMYSGFKNKDEFSKCLFYCFIVYLIQAITNISIISVSPFFYMIMGFMISEVRPMNNDDIVRIENSKKNKNTLYIKWTMTKLCNYSCDFCIQGNKKQHALDSKGESKKIRKEITDKLIDFIENKNPYKKVRIYLIGGEVTILPDFYEILEKLVNSKFSGYMEIQITTNLSANQELLIKIKELFRNNPNRRLNISASFYKSFTTEVEFMDKVKLLYANNRIHNYICKKILKLDNSKLFTKLKKKNYFNLNINVGYPIVTDIDYKEYKKFKIRYNLCVDNIKYIVIRKYDKSISNKLKNKLNKKNDKLIKVTLKNGDACYFTDMSKLNLGVVGHRFNPCGLYCDIGTNYIAIDSLGDVSRCQSCPKKTYVYNILEHDIKLFDNMIKCPNDSCDCNYYHLIERK